MTSIFKLYIKHIITSCFCSIFIFLLYSCREHDKTAPIITLIGSNDTTINQYIAFKEPGYSAIDNIDGDLTPFISIKGQVDESIAKIYTIQYKVSDKAGNFAFKIRTVTIEGQ